jgi:hypothetical protein
MVDDPGHDPGHEASLAPAGFSWGEYVAQLVDEHGSLAALALRLAELASTPEDSASVERALRRLRQRGNLGGGDYGRRLLRAFGLPRPIEARVRWMGVYHSRFTDLPRSLCQDQLRVWDRPPVSESRARVWLELGQASVALRGRADEPLVLRAELGRERRLLQHGGAAGEGQQQRRQGRHAGAAGQGDGRRARRAAGATRSSAYLYWGATQTSAGCRATRPPRQGGDVHAAGRAGDRGGGGGVSLLAVAVVRHAAVPRRRARRCSGLTGEYAVEDLAR